MLTFLLHLGAVVGKQVFTTVHQDHRTLEETEDTAKDLYLRGIVSELEGR